MELVIAFTKDKKIDMALHNVQEIQPYPFPFVHPVELAMTDNVHIYAAVVDSHGNIKDYISYKSDLKVSPS